MTDRFDEMARAIEEEAKVGEAYHVGLRRIAAAALRAQYRAGQEAMRERVSGFVAATINDADKANWVAERIRALPVEES